jgi:hypothetical protein
VNPARHHSVQQASSMNANGQSILMAYPLPAASAAKNPPRIVLLVPRLVQPQTTRPRPAQRRPRGAGGRSSPRRRRRSPARLSTHQWHRMACAQVVHGEIQCGQDRMRRDPENRKPGSKTRACEPPDLRSVLLRGHLLGRDPLRLDGLHARLLASREPSDDFSVAGCFGWIFFSVTLDAPFPLSCFA